MKETVAVLRALIVPRKHTPTAHRHHERTGASRVQGQIEDEILALYVAGWSEANPLKIAYATTADYVLDDAFVGRFSSYALPEYFEIVRSRFGVTVPTVQKDLAFTLRGPMDGANCDPIRQYWREAPLLGLTGVTKVAVTPKGIAAEVVTYDLTIACEILRTAPL